MIYTALGPVQINQPTNQPTSLVKDRVWHLHVEPSWKPSCK